jgi:hypothetical protein
MYFTKKEQAQRELSRLDNNYKNKLSVNLDISLPHCEMGKLITKFDG